VTELRVVGIRVDLELADSVYLRNGGSLIVIPELCTRLSRSPHVMRRDGSADLPSFN
jgi:hypothetical protein